ncbi:hypothetical protein QUF80_16360 [Desulfococcaceae bacterium HSG8]|nr:hypothetical protein [Desulfococcaceae bacterium HSG8]
MKAVTSFYALHEMYLFAPENAPDSDTGAEYGKEAVSLILNTKIR